MENSAAYTFPRVHPEPATSPAPGPAVPGTPTGVLSPTREKKVIRRDPRDEVAPTSESRPAEKPKARETARAETVLAICDNELNQFIEIISTFSFIRDENQNPNLELHLLCPENLLPLALGCDLFSEVRSYRNPEWNELSSVIKRGRYQGVYYPGKRWNIMALGWFKGIDRRFGKGGFLTRIFQTANVSREKEFRELQRQGYFFQLQEHSSIVLRPNFACDEVLPLAGVIHNRRYVLIEPFASDGSQMWPASYMEKLIRLIHQKTDLKIVLNFNLDPDQEKQIQEKIGDKQNAPDYKSRLAYFKRWKRQYEADNPRENDLLFFNNLQPLERAFLYKNARCVVASLSPEIILAKLLGTRSLTLMDLNSQLKANDLLLNKTRIHYIKPDMVHCNKNCFTCAHVNCLEHISPERAFENLLKLLAG